MVRSLGVVLLAAPFFGIGAQTAQPDTAPNPWRAWAFLHLGPSETVQGQGQRSAVFASLGGGVAASYGPILGMVRETDNEHFGFDDEIHRGVKDLSLLAGARSGGNHLFVAGALGVAQSALTNAGNGIGTAGSGKQYAPAFDLSAHADYRVIGLNLNVSGVIGSATTRYVAVSLGAEVGWFGF